MPSSVASMKQIFNDGFGTLELVYEHFRMDARRA